MSYIKNRIIEWSGAYYNQDVDLKTVIRALNNYTEALFIILCIIPFIPLIIIIKKISDK